MKYILEVFGEDIDIFNKLGYSNIEFDPSKVKSAPGYLKLPIECQPMSFGDFMNQYDSTENQISFKVSILDEPKLT